MTSPIPAGVTDVSGAPIRRPSDRGKYGTFWQPGMDRQNQPSTFSPGGGGNITVTLSGPLFTGMVPAMMTAMIDEMKQVIASQILADWHANLDRSLQHPTPYYETQIMVENRVDDWVVHDRGIVYGPWLEGVSSRNHSTRFKGYASLRRAMDTVVRGKAGPLIGHVARQWIGRMN